MGWLADAFSLGTYWAASVTSMGGCDRPAGTMCSKSKNWEKGRDNGAWGTPSTASAPLKIPVKWAICETLKSAVLGENNYVHVSSEAVEEEQQATAH